MDMSDATKRKEPEPATVVEPATVAPATGTPEPKAKAKAAAKSSGEPDAKRLKATPCDPAVVKKQVEYYLSDENLRYDKFFSEKIAADKEGWLDVNLILSCNKMKSMRATQADVLAALKDSKIEIKDGGAAVRRPGNAALPALDAKPMVHQKKASIHAHDGGVVGVVRSIPEGAPWAEVKKVLQEKMPPKVQLWFVSEVNDKRECYIASAPFDGDLAFFEEVVLEVGGAPLRVEVCYGEPLQAAMKLMPKHIRDKRDRESRKRQKERNRPIAIGNQRFINIAALRGRVKEILNSRSDGELLKTDGSDFKLVKALLSFHPAGAKKAEGLVGIKVAKSEQGESRCFYMVKEDNVMEDFSAKKCLDAVELNPPYVSVEAKEPAAKKPDAAESSSSKAETAPEEKKEADAEGTKAEEAKEEAKETKAEETKAEETKETA